MPCKPVGPKPSIVQAAMPARGLVASINSSGLEKLAGSGLGLRTQFPALFAMREFTAPMRALREQIKPFAEMKSLWTAPVFQPPSWIADLQKSSLQLSKITSSWARQVDLGLRPIMPILQAISRSSAECQRIEAAGWLPHYTTPQDLVADETATPDAVDQALAAYYQTCWSAVRGKFTAQIATYAIDDEAKAFFGQALAAHEHGHYGLVCRSLFSEIERVARKELYAGATKGLASQRALRMAAEGLGLNETEPGGVYGLRLFEKLFDHLYAKAETPDELAALARDAVPNRHAAVHGLLAYDTSKNSLNMLVMTDFLFQVICALKAQQEPPPGEVAGAELLPTN